MIVAATFAKVSAEQEKAVDKAGGTRYEGCQT